MADNYLEKKYEEFQARKNGAGKKKTNSIHKMRRVFVTNGADGIGKAIVKAFRMAGNRVAFCDTNEVLGKETAEKTGTTFYHADIYDKEALDNCTRHILEEWGDLDILINNAGTIGYSPITESRVEDFEQILSVNLRSTFLTSRLLAIHRQSQATPNPYGRIINICSPRNQNESGNEGYAVSQGGIYSLTQALALSLSPYHITVNSIMPGWIQTCGYEDPSFEDHTQYPSGRVGKPEDIARICLTLCQEENDFINGENITIDGGMTKKFTRF